MQKLFKQILFTLGAVSALSFDGVASNTVYAAETNAFGQYSIYHNLDFKTLADQSGKAPNFDNYVNNNAKPSVMPVFHRMDSYQNANNKAYYRATEKQLYLMGLPVTLSQSGYLQLNSGTYSKTLPQKWAKQYLTTNTFLYAHPELAILYNNPTGANNFKGQNNGARKYVNIKKIYHYYYHVNIDKLLTYTRPKNWVNKYYKHGMNPKTYMVKGYTTKDLLNTLKGSSNMTANAKKLNKIHNLVYKDQRQQSDHNDFGTTTKY
ncbi:hypothetical protein MOO44_08595 [Nicoliella spurrieriana]|uniref:Uncharacterized protein n=1 Tax=Nicoliella spurrieriana TaxID=2925830 RepID=A0A976RSD3_9LACO|nr:hypothetical protein [Nicoliella spurrieriana]UQS86906.1 hypothetical protein MOO44_08595 [Nicoliella spurrieriana]